MQSFFRLPWSTDTGGDKLLVDSIVHQKPKPKPAVEIPLLNKQKRRRTDSVDSSPRSVHQPKKLKATHGGAVQPVLMPARGPDAHLLRPEAGVQVREDEQDKTTDGVAKKATVDKATVKPSLAATGDAINITPEASLEPVASAPTSYPPHQVFTSEPATEPVDMTDPSNLDQLRSVIDAQLNLEILLKHNELRMIEQELAKCQVALEQLRRCELIPYPGTDGVSTDIANGIGPALEAPHGFTSPRQPAPWGVTDGPYARHYAQWLIQDPLFDPSVAQPTPADWSNTPYFARATRGSGASLVSPIPTARSARSSAVSKGQLLQHDPSRPYRDPLVIKRQQDGKWVKLYCTKCKPERSDFNNVQGFLNHCRISHKDGYESHEAAAIACGRPVEVNEALMMDPPPPPPRHRSSLATVEAPVSKTPIVTTPGVPIPIQTSVHALNKPPFTKQDAASLRQAIIPRKFDPTAATTQPASTPTGARPPLDPVFVPSPQTPHLSKLLQQNGISGDLDATVTLAKRKADLSIYDCSDSESIDESSVKRQTSNPQKKAGGIATSRRPPHPTLSSHPHPHPQPHPRPQAIARPHAPSRLPAPLTAKPSSSIQSTALPHHQHQLRDSHPASPLPDPSEPEIELSPATAADSNPGLVSDHEDDEDYGDELDGDARSVLEHGGERARSAMAEAMVVEIEDGSDGEGPTRKRVGRGVVEVTEGFCAEARQGGGERRMR
jgi:ADA HAT complex component 1